jgi:hypothetical protein
MAFSNSIDATSTGIQTLSSVGVWSGSTVTQYGTLIGAASNAVSSLGVATNGQLAIGSTGVSPVLATITAGTGITVSNGAGTITLSVSNDGIAWSETSGVFTAAVENGYSLTGAATATLPAGPSTGNTIIFQCNTASAVVITAAGSQIIRVGSSASSAGGTVTSTAIGNALTLTYSATNTVWIARGVQGNWSLA